MKLHFYFFLDFFLNLTYGIPFINSQYSISYKRLPFACIEQNNFESLKLLVANGCEKKGLLHYAMVQNNLKAFEYLVKEHADINELQNSQSPLIFAAQNKKHCYLQILIENNADPSIEDSNHKTALTYAVENEDFDCVKSLLKHHSPTTTTVFENTPLYIAIHKNNVDLVYMLLYYGACPNPEIGSTSSFLNEAIKVNSQEIFKILLIEGADSSVLNVEELTPEYKQIYDDNAVAPDAENINSTELEKNITSIIDDFTQLSSKIESVIAKSNTYNFKEVQMTPVLNTQNAVISTFSRFIKRIDTAGKMIFTKRIALITSQIGFIASKERAELEEIFMKDEALWSSLITESKDKLISNIDTLDHETGMEIENLMAVFKKKKSDVFKAIKAPDESILKANRAQLVFTNLQLVRLFDVARKTKDMFESFEPTVYATLSKAVETLEGFQETLDIIRKSNVEVIVGKESAEKEAKYQTKELADIQSSRMQIDTAYLRWLEGQFAEISEITKQCLRMCLQ